MTCEDWRIPAEECTGSEFPGERRPIEMIGAEIKKRESFKKLIILQKKPLQDVVDSMVRKFAIWYIKWL